MNTIPLWTQILIAASPPETATNPLWTQILIAAIAGAVAAVLTAVLTPLVTDRLAQRRRQDEIYRTNIGNQINTLYFPLLEILKKLEKARENVSEKFEFQQSWDEADQDEFREELLKLIEQIPKLLDQGKEAYLTTKLAEYLNSFLKFVQDSIELEDIRDDRYPDRYNTAKVLIHTPFSTKELILHTDDKSDYKKIWEIKRHAERKKKEIKNIIYAPILSSLFDLRFTHDIHEMKSLISGVVQYSPHNPSPSQNL